MSNLVQSLGAGYFRDFFNGAIFMYEGKAHSVQSADARQVVAVRLADSTHVAVPNSHFMGFKAFEYPKLGYRRYSEGTVGYLTRIQSVHRGLRPQSVSVDWSPVTRKLMSLGYASNPIHLSPKTGMLAFEPVWDKPAEIKKLLAGEVENVVLNESLLIEPSLHSNNDWYAIYFNQSIVGSMDSRGRATLKSKKYERLILPTLEAA